MAAKTLFAILCLTVSSRSVFSQNLLRGMVVDSVSMQPLPNVNVRANGSAQVTTTSVRGLFSISAYDEDTIVFSRVGYASKEKSAKYLKENVVIFLSEENKVLKEITFNAENQPPWHLKIPPRSPYRNQTNDQNTINTPGFQGLQTFGPGIVLSGPISKFSKREKEKAQVATVREENYKSRDYVSVVNDSSVKNKIMRDYSLTENEYYRLLAIFNEKNKGIIYELDPNELISILVVFYSENSKKK